MVTWPCLLKLDGDDELIYLRSHTDLDSECEALILGPDDYVIDSNGNTFGLQYNDSNTTVLQPEERTLSVEEVTSLIQSHEFCLAQRCIIKIHFTSVQQAVEALAN
ncbi:TPA: DUF4144 domain-containing protein [Vibrio parahaemolyticus]|uniref:DUF4144 domain-containing protein n=1 Tax=Vibrio parahaemolyticus TaxID=670 RepID=UPI00041DFCA2|nr:DUF4144 domain-containing protein [Vibrio parahaemolyticus]EGR3222688.1 hypothetical protein [Vibrio parahaemolyticus]EHE7895685.1 hypothetical protein [Vibrio parahaemolyticus]EJC6919118.1 DUF4144 domain-containing protein [Vibrio parahaemolyticus]EJE4225690.1 DUF4144 domain-containing protein [Vibrio parahaemolyticus]EKB1950228.1 DUF4144 domain-containing protein [Vibrio parahaemolyticus]